MRADDTIDSICSGHVRIRQPRKGYRFALDSVLLAHFIKTEPGDCVLEIGCGTGVVIALLAHFTKFQQLTGIEIQQELAEYAVWNLEQNQVPSANIIQGDAKEVCRTLPPQSFDVIFSNPPYRKLGSGRLNPSTEKAIARHEVSLQLADLFGCAERLLKQNGRLTVILPDFRKQDFDSLTREYQYFVTELRWVHSFADQPPVFFLATVNKTDLPYAEHPRLVIYEKRGEYTAELQGMLSFVAATNAEL